VCFKPPTRRTFYGIGFFNCKIWLWLNSIAQTYVHRQYWLFKLHLKHGINFTGVFKTTQPPQTKFTSWKLQWTAFNQTKNFTWIRLISLQSHVHRQYWLFKLHLKHGINFTGVFKTTQPPQTKFTSWKLQWTAFNQTKNFTWLRLISLQSLLTLSFVITDWLRLIWRHYFPEKITQNTGIVFNWRQFIAIFTPWILSIGGCVVLKTPAVMYIISTLNFLISQLSSYLHYKKKVADIYVRETHFLEICLDYCQGYKHDFHTMLESYLGNHSAVKKTLHCRHKYYINMHPGSNNVLQTIAYVKTVLRMNTQFNLVKYFYKFWPHLCVITHC